MISRKAIRSPLNLKRYQMSETMQCTIISAANDRCIVSRVLIMPLLANHMPTNSTTPAVGIRKVTKPSLIGKTNNSIYRQHRTSYMRVIISTILHSKNKATVLFQHRRLEAFVLQAWTQSDVFGIVVRVRRSICGQRQCPASTMGSLRRQNCNILASKKSANGNNRPLARVM